MPRTSGSSTDSDGVDERVPDRLDEARVARQPQIVGEADEVVGAPIFHSWTLIQSVNTHGNTMTASTTTSAGTTNGQ